MYLLLCSLICLSSALYGMLVDYSHSHTNGREYPSVYCYGALAVAERRPEQSQSSQVSDICQAAAAYSSVEKLQIFIEVSGSSLTVLDDLCARLRQLPDRAFSIEEINTMPQLGDAINHCMANDLGREFGSDMTWRELFLALDEKFTRLQTCYRGRYGDTQFSSNPSVARIFLDEVARMVRNLKSNVVDKGLLDLPLALGLRQRIESSDTKMDSREVLGTLLAIRSRIQALELFLNILWSFEANRRVIVYALLQVASDLRLLFVDEKFCTFLSKRDASYRQPLGRDILQKCFAQEPGECDLRMEPDSDSGCVVS